MNSVRRHRLMKDTVMGIALTIGTAVSLSGPVFAENHNHRQRQEWTYHHRERPGREAFMMGVCVGQTLAQQGITLPMPEAGKPPALDPSQREAIHDAAESCRASMSGRPMQTPTPEPTPAPTASPTTSPTEVPTPAVTVTEVPNVGANGTASPTR